MAVSHAHTDEASVKEYAGITGSSLDALIDSLIDNLTEWVEGQIGGRRILKETYTDELYDGGFGFGGADGQFFQRGGVDIFLRQWPVSNVTKKEFNTGTLDSPTYQEFSANTNIIYEEQGIIHFPGGTPRGRRNLRFTYDAGFDEIPADLALLANQLISLEIERRRSQGKREESIEGARIVWAVPTSSAADFAKLITAEQNAVIARYRRHNVYRASV